MKPFTKTGAALFGIIAVVHLLRLITRWEMVVNGTEIPVWISAVVCMLLLAVAAGMWKEAK